MSGSGFDNNNNNGDDEFGDVSFLESFDVDEAVQKHRESFSPSAAAAATTTTSTWTKNNLTARGCDGEGSERRPEQYRDKDNAFSGNNSDPNSDGNQKRHRSEDDALRKTLLEYFGYSDFRDGQLEVIRALTAKREPRNRRDAAVFWATGRGKSLCYQIPALHLNSVAVVVSPLISLMQDQVHKLNGLLASSSGGGGGGGNGGGAVGDVGGIATFLGSAQSDPREEGLAMSGRYNIVYVTPEKLSSPGFLDRLAAMHRGGGGGGRGPSSPSSSSSSRRSVCLFAVDEAHCVSEWGHDFRPEFRILGQLLRGHDALKDVPILALTATAVPAVQRDILQSLRMRLPLVSRQSFDRDNLRIKVLKKHSGGLASIMGGLVDALKTSVSNRRQQSTIVYCPTRQEVEDVGLYLRQRVQDEDEEDGKRSSSSRLRVDMYHAGLSAAQRERAHLDFLTGRTTVMVATVAFGMGIDKPDIRRIVHYGPPKTVEEYYQQIGRAGRDGLPSECVLHYADGDFNRYLSDFYLGGLSEQARRATVDSIDALKRYARDSEQCRRAALLRYFHERPRFGNRCGTCDTCLAAATYGDGDLQRDFGPAGARVALKAVSALREQGLSNTLKVISGGELEGYRYQRQVSSPGQLQEELQALKDRLAKKFSKDYYRDLIAAMVDKGYLSESTKSMTVPGQTFSRTWTTYSITARGTDALKNESVEIVLPVPESVREWERKEEERRQRVLKQLEDKGIARNRLPEQEVELGDGETIRAYSKWHAHLDSARKAGRGERVSQLEALLAAIEEWRSETAIKCSMAPGSVLVEHTMVSVAYAAATMPPGAKLNASSLIAAGVRSREIDRLVDALGRWVDEVQPARREDAFMSGTDDGPNDGGEGQARMVLETIRPERPWRYAVYKKVKKTGLAAWESSYVRFQSGESPQTIAMTPQNGRKPLQVRTIVGHLLDAILHGRVVDLTQLAEFVIPPNRRQWELLKETEAALGLDVSTDDPASSGPPAGEQFTMTEFLRPIIGDTVIDSPPAERTETDRDNLSLWYDRLKLYLVLRRVGYEPVFTTAAVAPISL